MTLGQRKSKIDISHPAVRFSISGSDGRFEISKLAEGADYYLLARDGTRFSRDLRGAYKAGTENVVLEIGELFACRVAIVDAKDPSVKPSLFIGGVGAGFTLQLQSPQDYRQLSGDPQNLLLGEEAGALASQEQNVFGAVAYPLSNSGTPPPIFNLRGQLPGYQPVDQAILGSTIAGPIPLTVVALESTSEGARFVSLTWKSGGESLAWPATLVGPHAELQWTTEGRTIEYGLRFSSDGRSEPIAIPTSVHIAL